MYLSFIDTVLHILTYTTTITVNNIYLSLLKKRKYFFKLFNVDKYF